MGMVVPARTEGEGLGCWGEIERLGPPRRRQPRPVQLPVQLTKAHADMEVDTVHKVLGAS